METVWAAHQDTVDGITGWEMRGPGYKGFSKSGTKTLFRLGQGSIANRVAVTESAIDTLSLGSIEIWPDGTVYVSTSGGYGPATHEALRALLTRDARLVAATDRGAGGAVLAHRLRALAIECGVGFDRLQPAANDWNDQLARRG